MHPRTRRAPAAGDTPLPPTRRCDRFVERTWGHVRPPDELPPFTPRQQRLANVLTACEVAALACWSFLAWRPAGWLLAASVAMTVLAIAVHAACFYALPRNPQPGTFTPAAGDDPAREP